ncbi:MAG: PilZ domain-containing protein [Gammaproteobacteria bacterium]|nr:PilZ domain-containing protein [Gammaproteobacteria bacterium]
MSDVKQRQHYRLNYPEVYRPLLVVDVCDYEIEDISQYGLKFKVDDDLSFLIEDEILAVITFPSGKEYELSGQVIRVDQGYVSVKLDTPLPLDLIKSESLHVHYHFPGMISS